MYDKTASLITYYFLLDSINPSFINIAFQYAKKSLKRRF
jgi:hypothetical protein